MEQVDTTNPPMTFMRGLILFLCGLGLLLPIFIGIDGIIHFDRTSLIASVVLGAIFGVPFWMALKARPRSWFSSIDSPSSAGNLIGGAVWAVVWLFLWFVSLGFLITALLGKMRFEGPYGPAIIVLMSFFILMAPFLWNLGVILKRSKPYLPDGLYERMTGGSDPMMVPLFGAAPVYPGSVSIHLIVVKPMSESTEVPQGFRLYARITRWIDIGYLSLPPALFILYWAAKWGWFG